MMSNINTNFVWQEKLKQCLHDPSFVSEPRGMEVREALAGQYSVKMPAYLNLTSRSVNKAFMFAEASWIASGNNRLSYLTEFMKAYSNFSDDGVFLRGAYGPKVVDQFGYVVDSIVDDLDTRQAVINIWRERPSRSKDIPCTLSMQFLVRNGVLHSVVTMRSNDVVLGFTYDVFTFSMVAKAVQLLLKERGVNVRLGVLTVTAGSLHLYKQHYEDAQRWINDPLSDTDPSITAAVENLERVGSYDALIKVLDSTARGFLNERG